MLWPWSRRSVWAEITESRDWEGQKKDRGEIGEQTGSFKRGKSDGPRGDEQQQKKVKRWKEDDRKRDWGMEWRKSEGIRGDRDSLVSLSVFFRRLMTSQVTGAGVFSWQLLDSPNLSPLLLKDEGTRCDSNPPARKRRNTDARVNSPKLELCYPD